MPKTRIKAYITAKPHIILGNPSIVFGLIVFTIPVGSRKLKKPTTWRIKA